KKLAFVSRGELFVSDVEGKFIRCINRGSAERVSEVKWLSDNKTLLFNQTLDGYQNWYSIAADGSAGLKQLTSDKGDNRSITFNKDKTKAAYYSGRNEVRIMDLKTMESKTIAKDEIWAFTNSSPMFSPADDYVVFTAHRNFEEDIMLYQVKENKTFNLTNTGIMETTPMWSPDGKYIYFTSARLKPSYPFGPQSPHVYRVPLEKLDEPYRYDKYNELFKDNDKKDTVKKDSTKKDSTQKAAPAKTSLVSIDMDGIMDRLEQISPSFGGQNLQWLLQKDNKTTVLYSSNHSEGRNALWKTVLEPFENPKTEKITGTEGGGGMDIVVSGDKYFILLNGSINKLNLDAGRIDPVNISFVFRRNLQAEFSQMFYEAWAQVEQNYYDSQFHGVDWKKIKAYYAQFLPYLGNRSDIRTILNDMLGELNSSHQGFYTFGADENVSLRSVTMETGILFDDASPYKVKYVVKKSSADKKGIDVQPGDVLEKVNDETVNTNMDRDYYFTRPSLDREIRLTFNRGGRSVTVNIHPQRGLSTNLYDEWIDNNQARVDKKSQGRIAYTCMKNMGTGELENFIIDM
ncbi:MAG: PD40 domain-containing protein, partial [Bacteroidetes bacterium]|nr:PD40 domain-containing protein [Bacteroidota bacterium]